MLKRVLNSKRKAVALMALILTFLLLSGCTSALKKRVTELEQTTADQNDQINTLERRVAETDGNVERLGSSADARLARLEAGPEGMELVSTHEIQFKLNKYELSDDAKAALDQIASELKSRPQSIVELIGQTDALGTDSYNFWLGERRAEEARRYLRERYDLPLSRLQSASYGEVGASKLSGQELRSGNQADRRVQLRVWDRPTPMNETPKPEQGDDVS